MNGSNWLKIAIVQVSIVTVGVVSVEAQIVPDGTLGNERSRVSPFNSQIDLIEGGAERGINLFHSFQDFNVESGRGVYFIAPTADIQNILARVTGSNPSQILGVLGTASQSSIGLTASNTNLFLINPNGIVFGKNAFLDVDRSFLAATANGIQFSNLGTFSASRPESVSDVLTVNPSAFLFSQIQPGAAISALGSVLRVPDGQSLMMISRDVSLDGTTLSAFGGRLELGSLVSPSVVALGTAGERFALKFPETVVRGNITLKNGTSVDVRTATSGGDLVITANNLDITAGSRILAGTLLEQESRDRQAGDIVINATGRVTVSGTFSNGENSWIDNRVDANANGNSGNISIVARSLAVTDGGQISASTFGKGNSGNLIVQVADDLILSGKKPTVSSGLFTSVQETGKGRSGTLNIEASRIKISEGSIVFGGTIGEGNAGNLSITTGTLNLSSGGSISATTSGKGNAGSITVNARDRLIIESRLDVDNETGIINQVTEDAIGNGNSILIEAGNIFVRNGGVIRTGTFGRGNAGDLTIHAADLIELSTTQPENRNPGEIRTDTESKTQGNAGNLEISAKRLIVTGGAAISTSTSGIGNAGNLTVRASQSITLDGSLDVPEGSLRGQPGGLLAQVDGFAGNEQGKAGNIFVETPQLSMSNGSKIQAATFGNGDAGTILIRAKDINIFNTTLTSISPLPFATAINVGVSRDVRDTTRPKGGGGRLTIETERLKIQTPNGGTRLAGIQANTDAEGNAGQALVRASDFIDIAGAKSFISATVGDRAIGQGGILRIETPRLTVRDRGEISVNSEGEGVAGNIEIATQRLTLDEGKIRAQTASGQGGNITLDVQDLLLLRRNSQISATAGTAQAGGDGGNINIAAKFVVAIPRESSSITANAFNGSGGNINIAATRGILGFQNNLPRTTLSAITASSQFGVSGTVNLIAPDTSTIQNNLSQLPQTAIDTNTLLANSCIVRNQQNGSFYITGTGGLPTNPGELSAYPTGTVQPAWKRGDAIVEPQGVYQLSDGRLIMSRECE